MAYECPSIKIFIASLLLSLVDDVMHNHINTIVLLHNFIFCWPFSNGGFKILPTTTPFEFYGGFQPLPPFGVPCKVYEFPCKIPSILQVKQVHASHLLSYLFGNDNANLHGVALYFFALDNIYSLVFVTHSFIHYFFFLFTRLVLALQCFILEASYVLQV